MYKSLPYNPKLKELAKQLRKRGVLSEVILWNFLKNKQMCGFDFNRQKPIDEYIVDFCSFDLDLVIEIDGSSHGDKIIYDQQRENKLKSLGLSILHFSDSIVKKDIDSVLRTINDWIIRHTQHPHTPASGHPSQEGNECEQPHTPASGHPSQEGNECEQPHTPASGHPSQEGN